MRLPFLFLAGCLYGSACLLRSVGFLRPVHIWSGTVIYSLIYAAVSAFAVDHEHSQNINVEVRIITKLDDMGLEQEILQKMDRGITRLESTGAYTNEKSNMLYILVSKYEVGQLKNIVLKYDPHAFIVMNEGVTVIGHYKKKL